MKIAFAILLALINIGFFLMAGIQSVRAIGSIALPEWIGGAAVMIPYASVAWRVMQPTARWAWNVGFVANIMALGILFYAFPDTGVGRLLCSIAAAISALNLWFLLGAASSKSTGKKAPTTSGEKSAGESLQ